MTAEINIKRIGDGGAVLFRLLGVEHSVNFDDYDDWKKMLETNGYKLSKTDDDVEVWRKNPDRSSFCR